MRISLLAGIILSTSIFNFAQSPDWINFFHAPGNVPETIENVTFDNSGNIYMSGYGYFVSGGQGDDFLTIKINSSGTELWQNVFNGAQNSTERPYGMFVDDDGNVYVTGTSRWNSNAYKIVTLKYSAGGSLLWRCVFDSLGQSDGEAHDVYVDNVGNVFVTGRSSPANNSYYKLITIKLDANGNVLNWNYFEQVANTGADGTNIILDNDGNIYSAGYCYGGPNYGMEVVLIRYNSNLDTLWTSHINGSNNSFNEFAVDIAVDDTGNVYLLCWLQNSPGSSDFAVLKINTNGDVVWREEFDEAGNQDIPEAMTMDSDGNIYVTGRVRRTGGGGYNDFAVIKYDNAGIQQWVSYYNGPNNLDDDPIDIALDQNGNIYVCGESNSDGSHFKFIVVKFNPDGSSGWDYIYDENVSSRAFGVWADNSGNIYAAGDGEGSNGSQDFMAVKLSQTSGVNDNNAIPNQFELYQNYPNPFNPNTVIKYQLPETGFVTLKVYDVLGNEVATLINEEKTAGSYEIEFNSHSDESQNLPAGRQGLSSGIYFYQIKVENKFIETKKLVLLK